MFYKIKKYLLLILLISTSFLIAETPTERYLQRTPIETISQNLFWVNDFQKNISLFQDVVACENEMGFFGYHSSSQKYRIFQDVLRAVMEEVFEFNLPDDFYFLRVPGQAMFDFPKGVDSFLDKFDRKHNALFLDKLIDRIIFSPLKEKTGFSFTMGNFTQDQSEKFRQVIVDLATHLDQLGFLYPGSSLSDGMSTYMQKEMTPKNMTPLQKEFLKKIKLALVINDQLGNKRMKGFHYNSNDHTKNILGVFDVVSNLNDRDRKHIENTLQQILKVGSLFQEIQNLTYYGGNFTNEMILYFFPFMDTRPEQQSVVVSMNIPLYGNYDVGGESTLDVFLYSYTIEGGDAKVVSILKKFFQEIGLEKELVPELFNIAKGELKKQNLQLGCLLQFYDTGMPLYQQANQAAFSSHPFGKPLKHAGLTDLVLGKFPLRWGGYVDLQLRLVTSNTITLNPYSNIRIKRYDGLDPAVSRTIIKKMKDHIGKASIDKEKRDSYRMHLETLWSLSVSDESTACRDGVVQ